jgi:outer membrane PBP1 activator LpoA protein
MQRSTTSRLLLLPLLYWCGWLIATGLAIAQTPSPDPASQTGPHIAVLLPLKSASIGRQADAVRLGVLEASKVHRATTLPLIVHATGDDAYDVVQAYEEAVRGGAQLVIGPLMRSAVTALSGTKLVTVPTLALNAPEVDTAIPPALYVFGLQVENEAKQVAQLARKQSRRNAVIVASDAPLSRRLAQAFADEFVRHGGTIQDEFAYTSDTPSLMKLRDSLAAGFGDVIFLALDATRARLIRSYLGNSTPIFATSMVHSSNDPLSSHELDGVYFVDMPWLLTPDHPAVMSYSRNDQAGLEFQRFYALGIDAYRISQELLRGSQSAAPIDGVTGYITLGRDHRFLREPIPAQFTQGEMRLLGEGVSGLPQ